ncbi:MAG: glycosyltransferase [Acidimicrobiales bacterium]
MSAIVEPALKYSFAHIFGLSNAIGTFEHADHTSPRVEHGFCTDDMARVLITTSREPRPDTYVRALEALAYRFVEDAQSVEGQSRNRRSATGHWEDRATVQDCWGRSVWAFGTAAHHSTEDWVRQSALAGFEYGVQQRSPWPRSMAFAALGAAEVLAVHPHHFGARALLRDAVKTIGKPLPSQDWPWPEARLTYANAVLPDALIAAGTALERPEVVQDGLRLLGWLLARETADGHLSPTPVGGSGPTDHTPQSAGAARSARSGHLARYDQQPIELATMADACARAATVSDDPRWLEAVRLAAEWFAGNNDSGTPMQDPASGGGFDGLTATGANQNCGAESTLAMISTLQVAARLSLAAC